MRICLVIICEIRTETYAAVSGSRDNVIVWI